MVNVHLDETSSFEYGFGLLLDQPLPSPSFSSPPSSPLSLPLADDPYGGRLIYAPRALKDLRAWEDLLALDDPDINRHKPSFAFDRRVAPKLEQAAIPLIVESLYRTSDCLHQIVSTLSCSYCPRTLLI